jgi:hypothetical protein
MKKSLILNTCETCDYGKGINLITSPSLNKPIRISINPAIIVAKIRHPSQNPCNSIDNYHKCSFAHLSELCFHQKKNNKNPQYSCMRPFSGDTPEAIARAIDMVKL